MVSTAARALSLGDPLGALKYIALRDDPPALALRGIAMAQLGELARARTLLRRAAKSFGPREPVDQARCLVAQAEVALAARDLTEKPLELAEAIGTLRAHGDLGNAAFAELLIVRRLLLLGEVPRAEAALRRLDLTQATHHLIASAKLVEVDVALRQLRVSDARDALQVALQAASASGVPALLAEAERAAADLAKPVARLHEAGNERLLTLDGVVATLQSDALLVDACRRELRVGKMVTSLLTRPVLFALLLTLARAPSQKATRAQLIAEAFHARRPNDTHRVRLRVELSRLRKQLKGAATVIATADGFELVPRRGLAVLVLAPPSDEPASLLVSLLEGGQAWSTSNLAAALNTSQRSVQRALLELEAAGRVVRTGRGRGQRWVVRASSDFATGLLLVARAAIG